MQSSASVDSNFLEYLIFFLQKKKKKKKEN